MSIKGLERNKAELDSHGQKDKEPGGSGETEAPGRLGVNQPNKAKEETCGKGERHSSQYLNINI